MKSQFSLPVILLVFCALAFTSGKSSPSSNPDKVANDDSSFFPLAVHQILVNSCLDCHGEGGKGLALSKVKMDKWGEYTPEKQAQKAADICIMVTKGKMPTKGYLKDHPEAALTLEQIAIICEWSAGLNSGN